MTNKRRFIKKLFLLAVGLVVIILPLNYLGTKAGNIYKDGAALVCQQKRWLIQSGVVSYLPNKKNVLFMGTSRILAGIVPAYFDELSGGQTFSYNLAFPALTISSSYFALKEYLEKNPPPDYILISPEIRRCKTCTVTNYYAVQGVTQPSEIVSLFRHLQAKSIIINYFFPFRMYKFVAFQFLKDSILQPQSILDLQNKNQVKLATMEADRGYYYIEEQAGQWSEEPIPKSAKATKLGLSYDPFVDPYVELFFDLAYQFQIKVMLIQPPFRDNQYLQHNVIPQQYALILKRYSNVRIAHEGWKMKFFNPTLFADLSHLNKQGALLYTATIFKDFSNCYPANSNKLP